MTTTLVSCVAENSDRWYQEAQSLVLSVRRFGGTLSDASIVVNFVDSVEPRYENGLAELGADVRVVTRFDRRTPASNKLRMLELAETHEFDVLLAIDTDTVVVGDVSAYADPAAVAVKPENLDQFPPRCWRHLFVELGLPEPSRSTVTTSTAQVTYPYFNSGVLFVPRDRCLALLESWSKRVFDVLDLYDRRPDIVAPPQRHWTNQLSLALAVVGDGILVACLPVAANLSTTVRVHPLFAHEVTPPFVLHYHNEMDADGFSKVPQRRPQPCHRCRQPGLRGGTGFGLRGHAGPTPGPAHATTGRGPVVVREWSAGAHPSAPVAGTGATAGQRLAKGPAGG